MYDRRWYDSHEHTARAFEILKDMDDAQRRALAKDLTTVVKQIKELHEEDEESDVSLGIDRVLGLYKLSNSFFLVYLSLLTTPNVLTLLVSTILNFPTFCTLLILSSYLFIFFNTPQLHAVTPNVSLSLKYFGNIILIPLSYIHILIPQNVL